MPRKTGKSWWPCLERMGTARFKLSMSHVAHLEQGRRRGSPRRHSTHHMALALMGTPAVEARCTRRCSLHRLARRSLHTVSPKFSTGGGDRTTGSRSRPDKRRPLMFRRDRDSFRSREMRSAVAGLPVWLHRRIVSPRHPLLPWPSTACTCASRRPAAPESISHVITKNWPDLPREPRHLRA